MDADEIASLQELGAEIAGAMENPWEPGCVARAFARPAVAPQPRFTLTMQGWIDLAAVRSPLLTAQPLESIEQLEAALRALDYAGPWEIEPATAVELTREMERAIEAAFALLLTMRRPGAGGPGPTAAPDGFGAWLPLLSALVVQCGIALGDALALPVARAFALLAAARRNEGWEVAGVPYALRDDGSAAPLAPTAPMPPIAPIPPVAS